MIFFDRGFVLQIGIHVFFPSKIGIAAQLSVLNSSEAYLQSAYNTSIDNVTVILLDAGGNVVSDSTIRSITISLLSSPSPSTLSKLTCIVFATKSYFMTNGRLTISDLSLCLPPSGEYVLEI